MKIISSAAVASLVVLTMSLISPVTSHAQQGAPAIATTVFASCRGGLLFKNSLEVDDLGWGYSITATVTESILGAGIPPGAVSVELKRDNPFRPDEVLTLLTAEPTPIAGWRASGTISKSELRSTRPVRLFVKFRLPGEPDKETCRVTVQS
jgi:hypothetical protein